MKDYSETYESSKSYVLHYEKKDGEIVVNLASGEKYSIPCTAENEQRLVSIMRRQAHMATTKPMPFINKVLFGLWAIWILPMNIVSLVNEATVVRVFLVVIGSLLVTGYSLQAINSIIRKRDVEKMAIFLDQEEELNEALKKNNTKNMQLGIRKKALKAMEKAQAAGEQPININNIDNYSLSSLRAIRDNISRIDYFGFDEEPNIDKKEQGPVLRKTRD